MIERLAVGLELEPTADDDYLLARRHDIHRVRFDRTTVGHRLDRKWSDVAEQLYHRAGLLRIQVLNRNKGHPRCFRQRRDEASQRFESAGRRTDSDDRKVFVVVVGLHVRDPD